MAEIRQNVQRGDMFVQKIVEALRWLVRDETLP